jgi:putative transposase
VKVLRAYKTELDVNNVQRTALRRHAGAARWTYNWGLCRKKEAREAGKKAPTAIDLHRELNALKETELQWLYEVSKCVPQESLRNLDRAFQNFFRRRENGAKKKGYPKFKSRKRGIGSFSLTGSIHVTETTVQLPRLGMLRLKEAGYLPVQGVKILRATVSERAGRWFVSLQVEEKHSDLKPKDGGALGIDVGVRQLAVLSDGTLFENPKALYAAERRLRHAQRTVARRRNGSANRRKAVKRVARLHYRVCCIRNNAIHKATSAVIAKQPSAIGIESLNLAGMVRNHRLARAVSDASLAELHRQLEYKARWAGIEVGKADRWFPSSKTCSACGAVKEDLFLGERTYRCDACGLALDRDVNAAINLRSMALRSMAASSAATACGGDVRPGLGLPGWAAPVKQEPDTI